MSSKSASYVIGYAYPSSPIACRLGASAEGCYYLQVGASVEKQPSYRDALAKAASLRASPDRWSIDHPLNAAFAPACGAAESAS